MRRYFLSCICLAFVGISVGRAQQGTFYLRQDGKIKKIENVLIHDENEQGVVTIKKDLIPADSIEDISYANVPSFTVFAEDDAKKELAKLKTTDAKKIAALANVIAKYGEAN